MQAQYRRLVVTSGLVFAFLVVALWLGVARAALMYQNGQDAALVLGQVNFTTTTNTMPQSKLNSPAGIVVDPVSQKIFIADSGNNRVLRFASLAELQNGAKAEGVLGQADFYSSTGATSSLGMKFPVGLAIDANGRLWVADSGNHRILRFDNAATKADGAAANGVLGQANFTTSDTDLSASGMNTPQGLAVDSNGRLWVEIVIIIVYYALMVLPAKPMELLPMVCWAKQTSQAKQLLRSVCQLEWQLIAAADYGW
jgi:hypothetical protein